jgi:hypothetical protein
MAAALNMVQVVAAERLKQEQQELQLFLVEVVTEQLQLFLVQLLITLVAVAERPTVQL